jgi:hypothetical protein
MISRETTFVVKVWSSAVIAGGAVTALFLAIPEGGISGLILIPIILFFAATRGFFSFVLFYFLVAITHKYNWSFRNKITTYVITAPLICITNMYLFLYRNKPEEFFLFGPHLIAFIVFFLITLLSVLVFRKTLIEKLDVETTITSQTT